MIVSLLFFILLFLILLVGIRIGGLFWALTFFGITSIILVQCDPRDESLILETTICIQEDDNDGLYLEYESHTHHITRDGFLHSWGCIQKGDSVHVYLTENYKFENLIYSRNPKFVLVKEESQ